MQKAMLFITNFISVKGPQQKNKKKKKIHYDKINKYVILKYFG